MIGNILLSAASVFCLLSMGMYFFTERGKPGLLFYARIGYYLTSIFSIVACLILFYAIITHQYQYSYVYSYSNNDLPFGLLLSTFYAGQEGSLMLWLLFTVIIGMILIDYTSKRENLEPKVMFFFSLSTLFLLIMVSPFLKSPFSYIWSGEFYIDVRNINYSYFNLPYLKNFFYSNPQEGTNFVKMNKELYGLLSGSGIAVNDFIIHGKGLNPLLQNFWMQIHPPVLFVAFAMAAVPFAFAMAALLQNNYNDWVIQSFPWLLSGMLILGLAIMLGGYWAYRVLGWGGYWGWDPVENSSLVPLITGVAAVHTFLIQKKTAVLGMPGKFIKTNLILSMLVYILVLYSTFLTRSGLLGEASVHSFVDPGEIMYIFLIIFIGIFLITAVLGLLKRWKSILKQNADTSFLSKEAVLFAGSVVLLASAVIIITGTSAPLFGSSVDISFYNRMNIPIAIIIGLINGLSLMIKWDITDKKSFAKELKIDFFISFILSVTVALISGMSDFLILLFTFSSFFTIVVNSKALIRNISQGIKITGGLISHIGVGIFFLGVIASGNFSETRQIELTKGEKKIMLGYEFVFQGAKAFDNGKKFVFNVLVSEGSWQDTAKPVMFLTETSGLMREPDILNKITKDVYVTPLGYDENASRGLILQKGQTSELDGIQITFSGFNMPPDAMQLMEKGEVIKISAELKIDYRGKTYKAEPYLESDGKTSDYFPFKIEEINREIEITGLDASGAISLNFKENNKTSNSPTEILTVEVCIKPFINLVWAGVIITSLGFFISYLRRLRESFN
ncbi:MAG: cytochrome c biogenesis protein CcsA [Ignavibacteria bacterium]|nr:cytochrome c biogenesis protein CcsA [Ignavibacteria bacterium]